LSVRQKPSILNRRPRSAFRRGGGAGLRPRRGAGGAETGMTGGVVDTSQESLARADGPAGPAEGC
jgi:hypothetical protein